MDNSKKLSQLLHSLQLNYQGTLELIYNSLIVEIDKKITEAKTDDDILKIIQEYNDRTFDVVREHTTLIEKDHDDFMNDPLAMRDSAISLAEKTGMDVNEILEQLGLDPIEETKLLEWKSNDDDDTTKH